MYTVLGCILLVILLAVFGRLLLGSSEWVRCIDTRSPRR